MNWMWLVKIVLLLRLGALAVTLDSLLVILLGACTTSLFMLVGWLLKDRMGWEKRSQRLDDIDRTTAAISARLDEIPSGTEHARLMKVVEAMSCELNNNTLKLEQLSTVLVGIPGTGPGGIQSEIASLRRSRHDQSEVLRAHTMAIQLLREGLAAREISIKIPKIPGQMVDGGEDET